jgi:hypothetical protein
VRRPDETVVAESALVPALLWVGFPALGAGAGWLLLSIAGWVASLPRAPMQGLFKLAASVPEPQGTIGALALGVLAGAVLAHLGVQDMLAVTVSDRRVTVRRGGGPAREIDRASVDAVFLDGKRLVLVGPAGEELAREASDLDAGRLADAFRGHGYPWRPDGDPYKDEFRRWVEDTPGLPAGANALLKARERALDKGDSDDAADLRAELAKLGIVVREEKKRQYWRTTRELPRVPGDPADR